jgi:hypothetical protein
MTTRDEIYAKFGVTAEPRHPAHDIIAPLSFPFRSATVFLLPQSEDSVDGIVASPA